MIKFDEYFKKYEGISNEELFKEYESNKEKIEEILIANNVGLIYFVINKLMEFREDSPFSSREEFELIGLEWLLQAIRTYDVTKGYAFSTYAIEVIKNGILRFSLKQAKEVKIVSLDEEVKNEDNENSKITFDHKSDSFEKEFLSNDLVKRLLNGLEPNQREIAYLYFVKDLSILEISKYYNRTYALTQSLLNKAIKNIRTIYEESFLSNDEVILRRFNNLTSIEKKCLLMYIEYGKYNVIAAELNIVSVRDRIKVALNALGCDLNRLKEVVCKYNLTIDNLEETNSIENDKLIIARFFLLKDDAKKVLVAQLSKNNEYKESIMEELSLNAVNYNAQALRIKKCIGFDAKEIKNCLERYDIMNMVINKGILDNKQIIKLINLEFEEKEYIEEKLSKLTEEELDALELTYKYGKHSQSADNKILTKARRKLRVINCSEEELILSLARRK